MVSAIWEWATFGVAITSTGKLCLSAKDLVRFGCAVMDEVDWLDGTIEFDMDVRQRSNGRVGVVTKGPDKWGEITVMYHDNGTSADSLKLQDRHGAAMFHPVNASAVVAGMLELLGVQGEETVDFQMFSQSCVANTARTAQWYDRTVAEYHFQASLLDAQIVAIWNRADVINDGEIGKEELERLVDKLEISATLRNTAIIKGVTTVLHVSAEDSPHFGRAGVIVHVNPPNKKSGQEKTYDVIWHPTTTPGETVSRPEYHRQVSADDLRVAPNQTIFASALVGEEESFSQADLSVSAAIFMPSLHSYVSLK